MELSLENVELVINNEINQVLKLHSGSCKLSKIDIQQKTIHISVSGGCMGCPSSLMTFYNFIEPTLLNNFGDVVVLLEE